MAKLTAKTFKYTHYMTLEEWKQWKKNFDTYNSKRPVKAKYKDMLSYHNFDVIISVSFLWRETPQGGKYWAKISQRTSPINQKTCKK